MNEDARRLLRSTGAVRDFSTEPVDDTTLYEVLDDARFAPSGGNRQGWRVAVVKDRVLRRRIAAAVRPVWDEYVEISRRGVTPFTAVAPSGYRLERGSPPSGSAPNALIDDAETVPVTLVVAGDLSRIAMMDKDLTTRPPMAGGASVYPFCWSILLAARARGLGGVLTTFLSRVEPDIAADLGLPASYALCSTIYLGYPANDPPTRLTRARVEAFATVDRFDGEPFGPYDESES